MNKIRWQTSLSRRPVPHQPLERPVLERRAVERGRQAFDADAVHQRGHAGLRLGAVQRDRHRVQPEL
jgi:hypothetical protein